VIEFEIYAKQELEESIPGYYRLIEEKLLVAVAYSRYKSERITEYSQGTLAHDCPDDSLTGSFVEVNVAYSQTMLLSVACKILRLKKDSTLFSQFKQWANLF